MYNHSLKARWESVLGQPPAAAHLEALHKKMTRDLKVEHYINTLLTDDDILAIAKQVSKDKKEKEQKPQPTETGGTQPSQPGAK